MTVILFVTDIDINWATNKMDTSSLTQHFSSLRPFTSIIISLEIKIKT